MRTIQRLVPLVLGLALITPAFAQRYITNVSADYAPTLFFETKQSTPFDKLPFETVELSVLSTAEAFKLGFIPDENMARVLLPTGDVTTASSGKSYLVVVESWQRFEVIPAQGVVAFLDAVEKGTPLDFSALDTFSPGLPAEKVRKTLIKLGVSFRVVFVLEAEKSPAGAAVPLDEYFRGNRRILAKIEIAGAGSAEMTAKLPSVFNLLSGQEGLQTFLRQATEARQQIWGVLRESSSRPQHQVLGWAFKPTSPSPQPPGG